MKTRNKLSLLLVLCALVANQANAHWTSKRPDGHAPIAVMAEHKHAKGEWMAAYRFMQMDMDGIQAAGYSMLPTDMSMDMHMLGAMYAPTDKWTWMLMANHIENQMDMEMTMMGMTTSMTMQSEGWGDLSLSGIFDLKAWGEEALIGSIGLGMPTGSIDEKKSDGTHQPYGMQLGSGTWDIQPGITYLGQTEDYSWGAQASALLRTGENDNGYTLGNRLAITGWFARKFNDNLSASIRLTGQRVSRIDGSDPNITVTSMMKTVSPGVETSNSGGDTLSGSVGINCLFENGHRIAAEYQVPLDQDLDGIQMERNRTATIGWQYAW